MDDEKKGPSGFRKQIVEISNRPDNRPHFSDRDKRRGPPKPKGPPQTGTPELECLVGKQVRLRLPVGIPDIGGTLVQINRYTLVLNDAKQDILDCIGASTKLRSPVIVFKTAIMAIWELGEPEVSAK